MITLVANSAYNINKRGVQWVEIDCTVTFEPLIGTYSEMRVQGLKKSVTGSKLKSIAWPYRDTQHTPPSVIWVRTNIQVLTWKRESFSLY
jgi:hypothetical protein